MGKYHGLKNATSHRWHAITQLELFFPAPLPTRRASLIILRTKTLSAASPLYKPPRPGTSYSDSLWRIFLYDGGRLQIRLLRSDWPQEIANKQGLRLLSSAKEEVHSRGKCQRPTFFCGIGRDESTEGNQQRIIESQTSPPDEPKVAEVPQTVDRQSTGGVPQLHDKDKEVENSSSGTRNARFIGDLNPEGMFLAATSPNATRGTSLDDSIGVWLNSSLNHGPQKTSQVLQSPSSLFYRSGSLIQKVLIPLLEQECLSMVPPPDGLRALAQIYFDKVYPIFPVVNESTIHSDQLLKPERTILQQGICLAASKNHVAEPYLVLGDANFSCREFGEKISGAMRMMIEMGLLTNKVVLIQALALLSQFTDDPPGEDLSSQ